MATDVICGMKINEKTTKFKSDYEGKTYYFCSQSCKSTFDKNPTKYASGEGGHSMHDGGSCCCC